MLWYLANGSLNEYLKSQIQLQGQYYSKQSTQLALADFSTNTGQGTFHEITLANLKGYQVNYALIIDKASVELASPDNTLPVKNTSPFKENHVLVTTIKQLTINKLTLNSEHLNNTLDTEQSAEQNNIANLISQVKGRLAQDYPELYPEISAKLYAQKNPQLDAEAYAKSHPQAGPIIEHKQAKKKRGKPQAKIKIQSVTINVVEINIINNDKTETIQLDNLQLAPIGSEQGIIINQVGGELLLALLNLSPNNNNTSSPL